MGMPSRVRAMNLYGTNSEHIEETPRFACNLNGNVIRKIVPVHAMKV
jgi:hypothetical protein